MNTHVLITGTIFRDPEQRSSKSGNAFVAATIKVKDGDDLQWWKVLAFHESAQSELMRLGDGDTVSVQGVFKVDIYTPPDKAPRVSLTVFATRSCRCEQRRSRRSQRTSGFLRKRPLSPAPRQPKPHGMMAHRRAVVMIVIIVLALVPGWKSGGF